MSASRIYNIANRQVVPDPALKSVLDVYFEPDFVLDGSGSTYAIKRHEGDLRVGYVNRNPDTLLQVTVFNPQRETQIDLDKLQLFLEQSGFYEAPVARMPREADTRIQIISEGTTRTPSDNYTVGDAVRQTWFRRHEK